MKFPGNVTSKDKNHKNTSKFCLPLRWFCVRNICSFLSYIYPKHFADPERSISFLERIKTLNSGLKISKIQKKK